MITTRIDLAQLNAKDSALLVQLFKANRSNQVFEKDIEYKFRCFNPTTNQLSNHNIILSNDVVRRPRNKAPDEVRYEVIKNSDKVGDGGFSQVYGVLSTLAVENNQLIVKNKKQRVVKIQVYSKDELKELYNEVDLTQKAKNLKMKRPAVIKSGDDEYKAYMVMRRLNGTDLYAIITQLYSAALDLTTYQRLTIAINLLSQIKLLHNNGIVHRDLKPENVMVDLNTKELEIFDFGLSKAANVEDAGCLEGTKGYIPPEVYAGEGTNSKSDVFSVAVIIGMLWYADEPGKEPEDVLDYQFKNIFNDQNIDLDEREKSEILSLLKKMTLNANKDRCTVDEALIKFTDIRDDYVNRQIREMVENRPKRYRLENGLFVNNTKKPKSEEPISRQSCGF